MSSVIEQPRTTAEHRAESAGRPAPDRLYRLSVEQYDEMVRQGILKSGDPIELIDGLLVRKMPKNPPHVIALKQLAGIIDGLLQEAWHLGNQDPIALDSSEPEPDLAIIRGAPGDYRERHPQPHEIGLLVEVADRTLADDRGYKMQLYARNGIVEYWIVNLVDERIEVYRQPSADAEVPTYDSQQDFKCGESVPLTLDGVQVGTVAVADVLS